MHRVRCSAFLAAVSILPLAVVSARAAQDSPVELLNFPPTPPKKPSTKTAEASLKVNLRLEDGSPFLGAANLRLIPNEGYEVIGTRTDTEGEMLFSDLAPGKYILEASAPGYLGVRLSTEIEASHHQRILYVVMKQRLMARTEEKTTEEAPGAVRAQPGANTLLATSKPASNEVRNFWGDHELEMNVPPVDPSVECPTAQVLKGVGERMTEFVSNLEKFTAIEQLEHYTMDAGKEQRPPEKRRFAYVVTVSQNREGTFLLTEYRDGPETVPQFPAKVATNGLPALDLIFHPILARDFGFSCEGLGQLNGKAAWQVHFAQRSDRSVRIRAYVINTKVFPIYLEGRVWIDPGNYQVVRLESELEKPIAEIALAKEHIAIKYAPVEFRNQKMQIWLPQAAEIYVERRGHRYYRRHTYTDFRLFNVDTSQNIQVPTGSYSFNNLSDQDVAGVLTVIVEEGRKREAVSVSVLVPAHGKVFKVVGPGKDVNLSPSAVSSATFVHNGKAESVTVGANLSKETTLDVIPETTVPMKP
jgi:hypothetical protein